MSPDQRLPIFFRENLFTGTDVVKMILLSLFLVISSMMVADALMADTYTLYPLLFCSLILLIAVWFPREGFRVTALLVAGFALIHLHYALLGFAVDPVVSGLCMVALFGFFGATTLFSYDSRRDKDSQRAISRYRHLVENTDEAKFLCDPETLRLLCVSNRYAEILGYAPQELVGVPAGKFMADDACKARFIEEVRRERCVEDMKMTFLARNGDVHAVLLSCQTLVPEEILMCRVIDPCRQQGEHRGHIHPNNPLWQVIQQSNDIFFMQDTTGRIIHFSWMRAPEYGISPEELIGKDIATLLPDDQAARHMSRIQKVIDGQEMARYNLDLVIAGVHHTFSVTITPVHGADSSLIGIMGSARDIIETRRQRLACKQIAWEINQWKEFITTMSHELRTPLQPLTGYLQLIVDDPEYYGLSGEMESYLNTCLRCAEQEKVVVERMIELSLFAMEHVELTIQEVSLRHLTDDVITDGGYDQEAEIWNNIPENVRLWGDPDRLYLVVESLIANAVKYNRPPKKVWVDYRKSNKNHYIVVRDTGIGIPQDLRDSITRPFHIGDAEKRNRKGGQTSPGLAFANKYIQLHGGEITVTGREGEGTTFTIRIPEVM